MDNIFRKYGIVAMIGGKKYGHFFRAQGPSMSAVCRKAYTYKRYADFVCHEGTGPTLFFLFLIVKNFGGL